MFLRRRRGRSGYGHNHKRSGATRFRDIYGLTFAMNRRPKAINSPVSSARLIADSLVYLPADINGFGSQILRKKSFDYKKMHVTRGLWWHEAERRTSPSRASMSDAPPTPGSTILRYAKSG